MGRKPAQDRTGMRDARVIVRVSHVERAEAVQAARALGQSLSDFVRTATRAYVEWQREHALDAGQSASDTEA